MKERIFSGAIIIAFIATIVIFNGSMPFAFNIALALISGMSLYELNKALGFKEIWFISIPSILVGFCIPLVVEKDLVFLIYSLYTLLVFAALIKHHKTLNYKDVSAVYAMAVIIPLGLCTLLRLRNLDIDDGMFYVLVAIFSAWIADAGAYFAGTFLGKTKLCPNISPKKTIEGAIGGAVVNIIAMVLFGVVYNYVFNEGALKINYIVLVAIGIMSSIVSIIGDLSFSLIKRNYNIKDFGNLIPGHGGILDRFDSVIFTTPFVYILITYFPIVI